MQWLEITLQVPREDAENIAEVLRSFGHQGVMIEHLGIPPDRFDDNEIPDAPIMAVRVYMPNDERVPAAKAQIEAELTPQNITPIYVLVDDENWADAWKKHYHPTRVGNRMMIRPVWEEADDLRPDDLEIVLDPGMAFGTGTHPTTQLCLASLEALMTPGLSVLDLGCGSGILAIGAVLLGATHVLAVDIDPIAVESTIENAERNKVLEKITAQQGGLETVITSARRFDLLVANILARTIIEMCDQHLGEVVRPGGKAIFSGIMVAQVPDVEEALKRTGLVVTHVRQEELWVAMEAYRPAE